MSLKRKTVTWLRKKSSVDPGRTLPCKILFDLIYIFICKVYLSFTTRKKDN